MPRFLIALLAVVLATPSIADEIQSYAFVQGDGSLKIRGRIIHLYGIHIPQTGRGCRKFDSNRTCTETRAAAALDSKIQGFVRCEEATRNRDLSINSICWHRNEDLSAWLLAQGWALALPGAPFEYVGLERIAREQGVGLWSKPSE